MTLKSRSFIGGGLLTSREAALEAACEQATAFCKNLPWNSIVSISHSHMRDDSCSVVVWYQTDPPLPGEDAMHNRSEADRERDIDETIRNALRY